MDLPPRCPRLPGGPGELHPGDGARAIAGVGRSSVPVAPDDARSAAYGTVATSLALRSDRRLGELVDAAVPLGTGIGGRCALLEVDGKPVFVKRVPLTELELLPEHVRSTANVFGLPAFCQYGIGGPGFGGFRGHRAPATPGTRGRGKGRGLLGRRAGGTTPYRGPSAVVRESGAVPGVHPPDAPRVVHRAGAGRCGVHRPGLCAGGA
ncbi:protein of unknown function [Streptomyces murinus]